jgi:hypothetical protein
MVLVNPGEPVEAAIELIVVQSQGRERPTIYSPDQPPLFFDNLYAFSMLPAALLN